MRVKFSKDVTYVPEWNGNQKLPGEQQIVVTLKPMLFDDVMQFMDAMSGGQTDDLLSLRDNPEELKKRVNIAEFLGSVGGTLKKYVVEIKNLEGEDGSPVTIEEVASYSIFMHLGMELAMKLVQISSPSEDTEGNSEGQSD